MQTVNVNAFICFLQHDEYKYINSQTVAHLERGACTMQVCFVLRTAFLGSYIKITYHCGRCPGQTRTPGCSTDLDIHDNRPRAARNELNTRVLQTSQARRIARILSFVDPSFVRRCLKTARPCNKCGIGFAALRLAACFLLQPDLRSNHFCTRNDSFIPPWLQSALTTCIVSLYSLANAGCCRTQ